MSERRDICFVVMPFGTKPIPDSGGRTYDFEKVYRVVLRRAIRQAGLEPLRADEISGSHMIHTDMFKNLRDRAVVLADLSLANPNVYYELGIRHVMASRGTVLTCRAGSELPFDVRLSRVVFYEYDGQSLDWEEAERVVNELQFALESAAEQKPDSPVHALLEQVLPAQEMSRYGLAASTGSPTGTDESLDGYQRVVAGVWADQGADVPTLLKDVGTSVFGSRSLGYHCLMADDLPAAAPAVAARLASVGQYDLANRIYERLGDRLDFQDLLRYGSSISEEHQDLIHAEQGLEILHRALAMVLPKLEEEPAPEGAVLDAFVAQAKMAGLLAWKWELSGKEHDLAAAVEALQAADGYARRLPSIGGVSEVGRLAQVRLRLLLLLRVLDGNPERPDSERLRDAVLELSPPTTPEGRVEASYLRWYQAFVLADAGDGDRSRELALHAFSEDSAIMDQEGCEDVGRRQYTNLRRFIDHYSHVLRHPILVAHVSQVLQLGHGTRATGDTPLPERRTVL